MRGGYFDIQPQHRIVLAYSMALNGRVHSVSVATILFADHGSGTQLTYTEQICILPPSDGAAGRQHGRAIILDGLGSYLAQG